MPALTTIEPPNMRMGHAESKGNPSEPKKKPKASSLCYTPPQMINDKKRDRSYFRRGLLGEGGFARCFEVTDFQGTRLAAKCIAKKSITSEKVKMKLLGEIKVHKSMDHPNIVRQRDCFEDDVNVYMILDICTNGTLMEMLRNRKQFTEPEVRYYGLQILGAAKYMHSRRVIHRDLKLGNLFLDEHMSIKVGDFGLAALLVDDDDRKKTICGTPNYIAPEVLFGSAEGHSYEVDLWSIGVILYAMLVGKPPFQSKDVKAIYAKIKSNEYEFPQSIEVSSHARNLIQSLLSTDPENRPSIDDIASHSFFNSGVMPRYIPSSAVKSEPEWPEAQASSVFKRNLNFVSTNAGIGQNQVAGREQGKMVDVNVEQPESGRYLPVSLSPRTGPAAKMLNLQNERAGGRSDTLSDRLRNVQLDENLVSNTEQRLDEQKSRDMRRMTLGAGALRSHLIQKENVDPRSAISNLGKIGQRLQGPIRADSAPDANEVVRATSRPKLINRVVSEPSRPITRSTRFTQAQVETVQGEYGSDKDKNSGLTRPMRRTTSGPRALAEPVSRVQSRSSSRNNAIDEELATQSRHKEIYSRDQEISQRTIDKVNTQDTERDRRARNSSINAPTRSSSRSSRTQSRQDWRATIWAEVAEMSETLYAGLAASDRGRRATPPCEHTSVMHISKWVDYSHRYGLGYQLSTEATGVYFNDATSIILPKYSAHFEFVTENHTTEKHMLESPPKALEKKVYLLKHFKGYMTTHLNNATSETALQTRDVSEAPCYMTHYWRTKSGILFRLSDGTIQLNFTDHSKLMIPSVSRDRGCVVRYVNVDKEVTTDSLARAIEHRDCREKVTSAAKILQQFAQAEGRPVEV